MKNLEYSKYASTQEKIRKTASDMMQKWVDKNGVEDRQKAIQFAKALSDKYGEAAASYACDMYDAIATSQNAKVPPAVPADTASWEEVGKAINGSLKQSIDGNLISGVVERLVKQAGEDTMLHNAARDRAEFAWVPDGSACAFCIMLASRGWQRASKDLLNRHAEHIHANCGCEFAIRFDKSSGVKGYDPDALRKMYNDAAPGKNSSAKIKALRRINNDISKSLTINDFKVANADEAILESVIDKIFEVLSNYNAKYAFEDVSIKNLGPVKVFDTILSPNGSWYESHLVINRDLLAGRTLEEINKLIKDAPGTRCNDIKDALVHEIYHSRIADLVTKSVIDEDLNIRGSGISGISTTAAQDKMESISEIGMLKERGDYATVPPDGKKLFEKYFEV